MNWFEEGVNKVADGVGEFTDAVERGAGEAVEFGADKLGDGLEAIGADGAAEKVRAGGDKLAGALGAHVDERQLGETDDPKQLIHGDVEKLNETVSHLKDFAAAFNRVADGMHKLGSGQNWSGQAADAFREAFDMHPKQWMHAADACDDAYKALKSYAETVSWAQGKASDAIEKYHQAEQARETALESWKSKANAYVAQAERYNSAVERGENPGTQPTPPGDFVDPGTEGREAAQDMLKSARSQRDESAERARNAIQGALAHAPDKPQFTDLAGAAVKDGFDAVPAEGMHLLGGVAKAGIETVNLARTVNPFDPYNLAHPFQYASNVSTTLLGLGQSAMHPVGMAKGMLGSGWGSDPAEASGKFLGNLIGGKGAGGLAKGALKAGAKDALKGAARNAAKEGGKRTIRDRLRTGWCKTFGSDPIDMATGRMILPQTDISLPAGLPLAFTRTFESSYRTGRWFGRTWMSTLDQRLEIDSEGVILIGEEGNFLLYPHPAVGVPTLPLEGDGAPLARTPDGDYFLVDPLTGVRRYFTTYTENLALLDEISDRHGNHQTFDYTEDGTPTAITHSAGYRLLLTTERAAAGTTDGTTEGARITALHLAGAATDGSDQLLATYGYDAFGHLTTVTKPSSDRPLRFTYDDAGRITSWTDTNGSSYTYAYDEADRCTSQGGIAGHLRARYIWGDPDPETGLRTNRFFNSQDQQTTYQVNDHHQIVATTDPTGATTRTTRDTKHRILSTTDPLGRTTHFTYDDAGRPVAVALPDGATSTTTYDVHGNPRTVTGPDGATWTHTYDSRGLRVATTDPIGATTTYTHDALGNLASVTDALGNTTHITCNAAGLPLSVTDPLGHTTHYARDAFGRTTSITDPLGATTHMLWTVEGKLAARTDPTGAREEWTYDGEGNRLTHTDAIGQTTHFSYTHFDLLAARTDPDGVRYEFTHDTELRLTQVTNPQGLTWNYTYDGAGRLISESDFDDRVLSYVHDAAGQLASRTNGLGEVTTYTRDPLGRITEKNAAGLITTYAHDPAGNLHQATNPDATVTYTRDALGRVLTETVNGRTMTYTYDILGRRTSRTTPTGHHTTYTYDAAGNCTGMDIAGHPLSFEYDAAGQELTRTIGDTLHLTHTWDPTGRLTKQSLAGADARTFQCRSYAYRPDGSLVGIDDHFNGPRTFDLDAAGRVTAVNARGWTETYAYDQAGNQTVAEWPSSHPSSEARGRRTYTGTRITNAGHVRYEHDSQGRITLRQETRMSRRQGTWRYRWDAEDRLIAVATPDGQSWRYLYDGLGRRMAKQRLADDGTAIEQVDFTWDGTTLAEQATSSPCASNPITLTWDHDGLRPIAQTERKSLGHAPQQEIDRRFFAIVTDLVGAPTELVDETGVVAWRARTTLWGTTSWTRSSTAYTPLRFPGQYFDIESGLNYNFFRYYDPETGRYATTDPLGLSPAPNPVTYVHNPHTWVDPFGLSGCPLGEKSNPFKEREAAEKAAFQHAGVPHGATPDAEWVVVGDKMMKHMPGHVYSPDPTHWGNFRQFETPHGSRVVVEHTHDPAGPHFHAGAPKGRTLEDQSRSGVNFGWDNSKEGYGYMERYRAINKMGGDHHFFYEERK
ncbi:putative T7SS-secreted protein [Streptomyces sp. S186]|uniref:putative T7SS-secreted protein n=1 Tax=Streptomyces sp. S186 TaxID=3434395 RepID=UPI003F675284